MNLGLKGRVALVTAASKGLGRGCALALAGEGCDLVISARGTEALEATKNEAEKSGVEVLAVACDVTDPAVPEDLVARATDRFGRLDVLVTNSGGPPPMRAMEMDDQSLNEAVNANLATHIRFVRAAVPHMKEAGWGRICMIASSSVKEPIPSLALSNTARTGLLGWAKTAAADLWDDGITLNLALPGLHATDRMKELGGLSKDAPMGDPEDFGKVVAFLCSEPSGFISGTGVMIDGARSVSL